jgi:hypothetical protein
MSTLLTEADVRKAYGLIHAKKMHSVKKVVILVAITIGVLSSIMSGNDAELSFGNYQFSVFLNIFVKILAFLIVFYFSYIIFIKFLSKVYWQEVEHNIACWLNENKSGVSISLSGMQLIVESSGRSRQYPISDLEVVAENESLLVFRYASAPAQIIPLSKTSIEFHAVQNQFIFRKK